LERSCATYRAATPSSKHPLKERILKAVLHLNHVLTQMLDGLHKLAHAPQVRGLAARHLRLEAVNWLLLPLLLLILRLRVRLRVRPRCKTLPWSMPTNQARRAYCNKATNSHQEEKKNSPVATLRLQTQRENILTTTTVGNIDIANTSAAGRCFARCRSKTSAIL